MGDSEAIGIGGRGVRSPPAPSGCALGTFPTHRLSRGGAGMWCASARVPARECVYVCARVRRRRERVAGRPTAFASAYARAYTHT